MSAPPPPQTPLSIPPELKKITQFIRRAEELDKDKVHPESRLVAYYCRQYAVTVGISLPGGSQPATRACLAGILTDLEREKEPMSAFTRDEALFICRKFASNIFDKADNEYRGGTGGKATAKTFYAAATFLEMLQQFKPAEGENAEGASGGYTAEMDEEDKKRRMYAKWKATEILKAIKEGRPVLPPDAEEGGDAGGGGDGGEAEEMNAPPPPGDSNLGTNNNESFRSRLGMDVKDSDEGTEITINGSDGPPPPLYPTPEDDDLDAIPPPLPPPTNQDVGEEDNVPPLPPPPAYAPSMSSSTLATQQTDARSSAGSTKKSSKSSFSGFGFGKSSKKSSSSTSGRVSDETLGDVIELTKFALSALEARDTDLGKQRLEEALWQLKG